MPLGILARGEVEMPPLAFERLKTSGHHDTTQQLAVILLHPRQFPLAYKLFLLVDIGLHAEVIDGRSHRQFVAILVREGYIDGESIVVESSPLAGLLTYRAFEVP